MTNDPDPVALALADALPDLSHPSGQRVWLVGLTGDKFKRTRLTCSEAIVRWFRKRSEDQHFCALCGTAEGEVQAANQRAAEAWQQADATANELRELKKELA